MNRASQNSSQELSHASQSLAEFFAGVVLIEEDGVLQPIEGLAENSSRSSGAELEAIEAELAEPEALPEAEPQPPAESQVLVSLSQLRQWYAIARSRQRFDRLPRIQALGTLFKQTFGDANPEAQRPFVGWSTEEVQWWLEDLTPAIPNSAAPEPRQKALRP